jgi:hypothetical protein
MSRGITLTAADAGTDTAAVNRMAALKTQPFSILFPHPKEGRRSSPSPGARREVGDTEWKTQSFALIQMIANGAMVLYPMYLI